MAEQRHPEVGGRGGGARTADDADAVHAPAVGGAGQPAVLEVDPHRAGRAGGDAPRLARDDPAHQGEGPGAAGDGGEQGEQGEQVSGDGDRALPSVERGGEVPGEGGGETGLQGRGAGGGRPSGLGGLGGGRAEQHPDVRPGAAGRDHAPGPGGVPAAPPPGVRHLAHTPVAAPQIGRAHV